MTYIESLKERARKRKRTIVLPEGTDPRPIKAAEALVNDDIVKEAIILGNVDAVNALAKEIGANIDGVTVLDPQTMPEKDEYIALLYERRKAKGMTEDDAMKMMGSSPLFTGAAMVAKGRADGMVGGCITPTATMIRSGLFLIGAAEGVKTVSSFFIMAHPNKELFHNGVFMFADCGVVPLPTGEQLADIATSAAASYRALIADDPRVALLSFSTKGSGGDQPNLANVKEAVARLTERKVDFPFDGELQFDAAMLPDIGKSKAPGSSVAGNANVFIFPDLNAGNICYKAVERLAGCVALGPILQGVLKPVNDLSRGCSANDIADVAAITALQVCD